MRFVAAVTGDYVDAPGNAIWSQVLIFQDEAFKAFKACSRCSFLIHFLTLKTACCPGFFWNYIMVWIDQRWNLHEFTMIYFIIFSLHTEWRVRIGFLTRWKPHKATLRTQCRASRPRLEVFLPTLTACELPFAWEISEFSSFAIFFMTFVKGQDPQIRQVLETQNLNLAQTEVEHQVCFGSHFWFWPRHGAGSPWHPPTDPRFSRTASWVSQTLTARFSLKVWPWIRWSPRTSGQALATHKAADRPGFVILKGTMLDSRHC